MADVLLRGSAQKEFSSANPWVTSDIPITGLTVGEYILLGVMVESSDSSPTSGMTGWTLVTTAVSFFFAGNRYHIYQKVATGDASDTPTIGFAGNRSGTATFIASYNQAVDPLAGNFLLTSTGNVSTAAPIVHAGRTATLAGSLAVGLGASIVGKSGTLIVDNSATMGASNPDGDAGGVKVAYCFSKSVGSGATGDFTVTNSDPIQIPQRYAWFTAIISPLVGGGGVTVEADNLTQNNAISTNTVTQTHQLVGSNLSQNNSLSTGTAAQTHQLAGANFTQNNAIGTGAVVQTHTAIGANLTQANSTTAGSVVQTHLLQGSTLTQQNSLATGEVSVIPIVAGSSLSQQNTLSTGAIQQSHILAGAPLSQGNSLTSGLVVQTHTLIGSNLTQSNSISSGEASQIPIVVGVGANLTQQNTLSSGVITQTHILTGVSLSQLNTLSTGAVIVGEVIYVMEGENFTQQNSIGIRSYYTPNPNRTVPVPGDNRRTTV